MTDPHEAFPLDDIRHGRYSGYVRHHKMKTPVCDACRIAGSRGRKMYEVHGGQMVTIGVAAWRVVHEQPRSRLAERTGLSTSVLYRIDRGGPGSRVYARTRDALLSVDMSNTLTPLGAARRLQALACLGWSTRDLYGRIGVWPDNLGQIRLGTRTCHVRGDVARRIIEVYDELSMTPKPPGRATSWTIRYAREHHWVPPLAWDDIDDPDEKPNVGHYIGRPDEFDEVAVERALTGDVPKVLTPADRAEIVRRAFAKGWTHRKIRAVVGISKPERYSRPSDHRQAV